MKRRVLFALLVLCMVISILPGAVRAETTEVASGKCGENLTWTYDAESRMLTISGTGEMYDYAMNEETGRSNAPWAEAELDFWALKVEDGVTSIGAYAFVGETNLMLVNLMSLDKIGDYAFQGCTSLETVSQYSWVTSYIGDHAFDGCKALSSSLIHEGLTHVGDYAFNGCSALKNVSIPDADVEWGSFVLANSGVTSVNMYYGAVELGSSMFYGCTSLESAYISNTVTEFNDCFEGCDNLTIYAHSDTPAAEYAAAQGIAFEEADHQHYDSWTGYPQDICKYCDIFGSFSADVKWILDDGELVVYGSGDMSSLNWKDYKDQIKTVVIEEGITGTVGGFNFFENLTSVSLPSTLTEIGKDAFGGCTGLTEIVFPEGIVRIDSNSFHSCTGLTEVHIPASVEYLGARPFGGCTNLTGIWVDEDNPYFTSDEYGVVYTKDMAELVEAPCMLEGDYVISETVTSIRWAAFDGCSSLTSVVIPDGVEWVEMELFIDCTSLREVTIPDSVVWIWLDAFENCTSLESITIPSNVNTIEAGAFKNCTALKSIIFEGDVPSSFYDAFTGVTATAYYPLGNETWTSDVMQDYGGDLTWVGYAPHEGAVEFIGASLSLKGDIGLNYYYMLSDEIRADSTAYMSFTGLQEPKTVSMGAGAYDPSDGSYGFTVALNAKNMADRVTAQAHNAFGPVGEAKTISIKTYADYAIANSSDAALVKLMKAMLNYGAAAQVEFGYNTGALVNADMSAADQALPGAVDVSAYASSLTGKEDGITLTTASLLLQSEAKIRVYFELAAGKSIRDYVFTVDGKTVTPVLSESGEYYIEKTNVAAKDLDTMYTFRLGGLTLNYCGLSYVNQVQKYSSNDVNLMNLAKSLYCYNQAANAFFG